MMTPSMWTQVAAYVGCTTLDESLAVLCELGWRCFELSTEHLQAIEESPDRQALIERAVSTLGELGAAMPQAHAMLRADVAHPDEARRAADLDRVERNLRTCAAMGVKVVVTHPGQGDGYTTRQQRDRLVEVNLGQFRRLADLAGELGLRIAVENMADSAERAGRRGLGALPGELLELLERLDHPALWICLDTSHANLQRLDVAKCVLELAPRLIATHISDNDGTGDQHRTPGYGKIDWPSVMAAFAQVPYEGPFNLEIPGENGPSAALVRRKIRHALEVTQWLVELASGGKAAGGAEQEPAASRSV
jgi:sugar phosphate isomerase/epimerase